MIPKQNDVISERLACTISIYAEESIKTVWSVDLDQTYFKAAAYEINQMYSGTLAQTGTYYYITHSWQPFIRIDTI